SSAHVASRRRFDGQTSGQGRTKNQPAAAFHDIERRAKYCRVIAIGERPRRGRVHGRQLREHAEFAAHVVGPFDLVAERPAAKDHLAIADPKQIRQVGMSVRELLDDERTSGTRQYAAEIFLKGRGRQLLAGADWSSAVEFGGHRGYLGWRGGLPL